MCANDVAEQGPTVLGESSENTIYLMMRPGHDAQIRNEMLLKILAANENMFGMWSRTSLKVEGKVDPSFWLKI